MTGEITNLLGNDERLFAEPHPTADETSFQLDNTSKRYYDSPYYLKHKDDLQPVPAPRTSPPRLDLANILPAAVLDPVVAAKRISFHSVGDTGAAKVNRNQTAEQAIANEASVADAMAQDVANGGDAAPAFFFHLGDVVYNFGEGKYYYDQFYEPFRDYDRPIFAIPGNHDGAVYGDSPDVPQVATLTAFLRNFCAEQPGAAPDAAGLVRSAMTQPGVYFTLDAPFVSIVGLYTNVLEIPGVISSEDGVYPAIGDEQLQFLTEELTRLKDARTNGERAVVIACHHPPVSADSKSGGTAGLAGDIDKACQSAGLWPDAVLSGHAHLYQRFTRAVDGREIPYVVSGSGGFAATPPQEVPQLPWTKGEYTLELDPIVDFGYLTATVDMSAQPPTLKIAFVGRDSATEHDAVTVDLSAGTIVPAT